MGRNSLYICALHRFKQRMGYAAYFNAYRNAVPKTPPAATFPRASVCVNCFMIAIEMYINAQANEVIACGTLLSIHECVVSVCALRFMW